MSRHTHDPIAREADQLADQDRQERAAVAAAGPAVLDDLTQPTLLREAEELDIDASTITFFMRKVVAQAGNGALYQVHEGHWCKLLIKTRSKGRPPRREPSAEAAQIC